MDSNGVVSSLGTVDTSSGVATKSVFYPEDGEAYAFLAKISPQGASLAQGIVSSPVQLTVSRSTRLLLNVSKGEGYQHTVGGWLKHDGSGVTGKTVKVKVNQTEYALQTDGSGYFSKTLDLTAVDNKSTLYVVSATFEGDQPLNATAWAYTLEGTAYPACTTVQHGYKPSTNMTRLTVAPQATDTITQTKTPEQLQQEAIKSCSPCLLCTFQVSPNDEPEER